MRRIGIAVLAVIGAAAAESGARAQDCPVETPLACDAGWCCPYGAGGRSDVCCNGNPQSSGCTTSGMCGGGGNGSGCPSSSPLACNAGWCCPYGTGGRSDVCCNDNPLASGCTANGMCSGGGNSGTGCPSSSPLACGAGWCCPSGTGGRTDVCCNGNPQSSGCTTNGMCSGGGNSGNGCPSSSPLACAAGWCCPSGTGGRTDVCCNGNPQSSGCTTNGMCSGGGSSGNACPSSSPLACGAGWCCPLGTGGRTDVCCNNNPQASGCTTNGMCSGGGTSGNGCPSNAPLVCQAGWCCPYGTGGRADVCCNGNPQASGCTANGVCSAPAGTGGTSGAGGISGSGGRGTGGAGGATVRGTGGASSTGGTAGGNAAVCPVNGPCPRGGGLGTGGASTGGPGPDGGLAPDGSHAATGGGGCGCSASGSAAGSAASLGALLLACAGATRSRRRRTSGALLPGSLLLIGVILLMACDPGPGPAPRGSEETAAPAPVDVATPGTPASQGATANAFPALEVDRTTRADLPVNADQAEALMTPASPPAPLSPAAHRSPAGVGPGAGLIGAGLRSGTSPTPRLNTDRAPAMVPGVAPAARSGVGADVSAGVPFETTGR